MDIRSKLILDEIKKVKEAECAVIAGGAVRDMVLGQWFGTNIEPKDVDIFIPSHSILNVIERLNTKGFKVVNKGPANYQNFQAYEKGSNKKHRPTKGVWAFNYEGVDIDLITTDADPEDFGASLVKGFDFGINMAYYDGMSVDESNEKFQTDKSNQYMSLINPDSVEALPGHLDKFNRLTKRFAEIGLGRNWRFRAPGITIKGHEEPIKKDNRKSYRTNTLDNFLDFPPPAIERNEPRRGGNILPVVEVVADGVLNWNENALREVVDRLDAQNARMAQLQVRRLDEVQAEPQPIAAWGAAAAPEQEIEVDEWGVIGQEPADLELLIDEDDVEVDPDEPDNF